MKTINIDKLDGEDFPNELYYKTIQYKSPRLSIKHSSDKSRKYSKNAGEISPWAIVSLENLEQ